MIMTADAVILQETILLISFQKP